MRKNKVPWYLGSFSITNKTEYSLTIQLGQAGVLYHGFVEPGGTFYQKTGAVHFTIRARINKQCKDDTNILKEGVLPVAACVGVAAFVGATAAVSFVPDILFGSVIALEVGLSTAACTGGGGIATTAMAAHIFENDYKGHFSSKMSSAGWYAGYKHELEIHLNDNNWEIYDVKYDRTYKYTR